MTLTVEAVYKDGVLRPKHPLALAEGTEVRLTLNSVDEQDPFADIIGICHSGRRDGAANHDQYLKQKHGR